MGAYDAIKSLNNDLIREGLQGSVFIGPLTAPEITATNLFDTSSGDLKSPSPLASGYSDLGWLSSAGAKMGRSIKTNDIAAWGSPEPVRSDITSDTTTLVLEALETKLATIGLYTGADMSTIVPAANGTFSVKKPAISNETYYRALALAVDTTSDGEIVVAKFLPRCKVTALTDQSFVNTAGITYGVTLTAYEDATLGYAAADLYGGAGLLSRLGAMSLPRTVTCSTTSASTTLTATTGSFLASDVGATLTGAGIPAGATVASFTDSTHVVMSAAATATATGVSVTVG